MELGNQTGGLKDSAIQLVIYQTNDIGITGEMKVAKPGTIDETRGQVGVDVAPAIAGLILNLGK